MTNRELAIVIIAAIFGGDMILMYVRRNLISLRCLVTRRRVRKFQVQARFLVTWRRGHSVSQWLDSDFSIYAKNEREAKFKAHEVATWYQIRRASSGITAELRNLYIIPQKG